MLSLTMQYAEDCKSSYEGMRFYEVPKLTKAFIEQLNGWYIPEVRGAILHRQLSSYSQQASFALSKVQ